MSATEQNPANASWRDELETELRGIEERVHALRDVANAKGVKFPISGRVRSLDDEEREAFRERALALSDVDLVSALMTFQKVIERDATGRQFEYCEWAAVITTTVLNRFAPEPFADALAVWSEYSEDDDDA